MQPPKKQLIKTKVEVHDRTQLETILDFFVRDKDGELLDKRLVYEVDAYFFLPNSMAIDPQTYPKEEFYKDIRPMLRFREPRFGFKYFLAEDSSFFADFHEFLEGLETGRSLSQTIEADSDRFKIAVCSYVSLFQRKIRKRIRKLTKSSINQKSDRCL